MSFVYSLFLKRAGEELSQFDNRISNMLPVAAGLVFFDMRNYRNDNGEFNVYIEWNEELNSILNDRLPSGGYFIKATGKQARQLEEKTGGIPVYMKLIAHEGRLYPYRTYVMWNGRPFSVEFNGNILIPVDYKKKAENVRIQGSQNGGKGNRTDVSGSQMSSQRGVFGTSQRGIFFGSQRGFLTDSNRGFFFESQNGFSFGSNRGYLTGSNREFWTSSNRPWMYEWEYENGSQRSLFGGSQRSLFSTSQRGNFFGSQGRFWGTSQQGFLFGSQREFLTGSNRGFFFGSRNGFFYGSNRGYLTGSNREFWTSSNRPWMYEWEYENGSQRGFLAGSRYTPTFYQATDGGADDYDIPHWYYMPPEWQLINRSKRPCSRKGGNSTFGYGLDLI
ncbi:MULTISPECIES: hypothetical protein [Coprococcus]|jgi:hypothetical protein|uniref:hypothetical protein n=2 Tax=Lachnospiraceae TaxID=186803 RepID=UPI000820834D|nr:hypothetical protein [Coprococcus ammoniilyticus]MCU6729822.1 hypothetical protein [Coprococcus ammoniilyticus]SCH06020.1 Uncharacterised protein [uncultured Coprococcus sp.]